MQAFERHLYQRVYAKAKHEGFSSQIACTKAHNAVREATGTIVKQQDQRIAAARDIPPDILADAERIKHLEHPLLVGRLMGDPLPGRSALDKMQSNVNVTPFRI